jgi:ATP-binding cassette subfamily F protein uup
MSTLLSLRDIGKSFGAIPLFSGLSLYVGSDERVGLIGANGSGKSTLLRIMAGLQNPDSGERTLLKGAVLGYLPQDDEIPPGTVEEVVSQPLRARGRPESEIFSRVGVMLGKTGFNERNQLVSALSGGWRKRLALARELVKAPDLLLLDEPTNHLDLESILWLEKFLLGLRCAFVVISHDRYFLENVSNRTVELGRGYPDGYFSVNAAYTEFLERREEFRQGRAGYEQTLANKVRREIEWLRRGPKARTTKAKFRIEEAGRLQDELAVTRRQNAQTGRAGIDFTSTDRKTKRLLVAKGLSKSLGGKGLFQDLDIVLSPGVRVGLVGLNGSGKTSLLRALAGELELDAGSVKLAPGLQVVVFDQDRAKLDVTKTLRQALAPGGDTVIYRDRPIHVASWAKRFLFKPEQLPLPVNELSGGEQARILIAQLMLQPADLLLLDEPTNNLDIQTLEVLEESLQEFPGAVVLISHDRYLLDRVSTVVLGLDGAGGAEVFADYSQWDATRKEREKSEGARQKPKSAPAAPKPKSGKLTYNEQREWDAMETRIQEAEDALAVCAEALEDPNVAADAAELQVRLNAHEQAQNEVDQLYARWEELEAKQKPVS